MTTIFYPDWKVVNKFRLNKDYKLDISINHNRISVESFTLLNRSKSIVMKSYHVDDRNVGSLHDNVTHIMLENSKSSFLINVDTKITAIVSKIEAVDEYK